MASPRRATIRDVLALSVGGVVSWLERVTRQSLRPGVEELVVVDGILWAVPEQIAQHLDAAAAPVPGRCHSRSWLNLSGGKAVYDERQAHKLPDWTDAGG